MTLLAALAAVVTSCILLITVNVWAIIWRRLHLPTDPQRLAKLVRVTYEQSQPHQRINGALFVAVVIVAVWWGVG